MKKLHVKGKKVLPIIAVFLLAAVSLGLTIAYNQDRAVLGNTFVNGVYRTVTTEDFVSPTNWKPCDRTPKTVTVTNTGNIDVAVRISYDEYWDGGRSLEKDGVRLVNIVMQNEDDWELRDGYYYYKDTLAPGESTSSLFKEVVLSCDANFGGDNTCEETETGTVCTKPQEFLGGSMRCWDEGGDWVCESEVDTSTRYDGVKYHLDITAETIQADKAEMWRNLNYIMATQAKSAQIDYGVKPTDADTGVMTGSENGKTVYFYRGDIDNNNVLWSGICWNIVRTTDTGGVKLVYSGLPTVLNGSSQCSNTGTNLFISQGGQNTFAYNNESTFTDVGYKYGARGVVQEYLNQLTVPDPNSPQLIFSKGFSYDNGLYTLDTSEGNYITSYSYSSNDIMTYRFHCLSGGSSCSGDKLIYIYRASIPVSWVYVKMGGFESFDDFRESVFETNGTDSNAKTVIESWFESSGLTAKENELEDAIFCNDRSTVDFDPLVNDNASWLASSGARLYSAAYRLLDDYSPTLNCANKRDSFTKDETASGNGLLNHKVGLLTGDEVVMSGVSTRAGARTRSYLVKGNYTMLTSTPGSTQGILVVNSKMLTSRSANSNGGLRPVVVLKGDVMTVSGNGTATSPYVVE